MSFIDFSQEAFIDSKLLFLLSQIKSYILQLEDIGIRVEPLDYTTVCTIFLFMRVFVLQSVHEKHGNFLVCNVFFNPNRILFL